MGHRGKRSITLMAITKSMFRNAATPMNHFSMCETGQNGTPRGGESSEAEALLFHLCFRS